MKVSSCLCGVVLPGRSSLISKSSGVIETAESMYEIMTVDNFPNPTP